jgi:hypothetical protein
MSGTLLWIVLAWVLGLAAGDATAALQRYDVVIYGGTPGGVATALAAAQLGQRVALIEPMRHVGGLLTSGLSHTDYHAYEGLTGTFLAFSRRVEDYYRRQYGPDSPQVKDCFRGTPGEPHVNERVLEQMLAGHRRLKVFKELTLKSVQRAPGREGRQRLEQVTFLDPAGRRETFAAQIFVDGTYEGDLMAMAGVAYRVGREGRDEFGESLAPEQGDRQVQAYNFRFIMTTNAANRVTPTAPPGYQREDFLGVLPLLGNPIKKVFGYPSGCVVKAHEPALPNAKHDINDVSRGLIRFSMPGVSYDWPEGDAATRARIFAEHLRYNAGLIYFLQNDEAVPATFREEARRWGWCRDEFTDNGHLPWQLYVREARRMQGLHIFTQRDTAQSPGDARAVLRTDAIAIGEYGHNCHGTGHEGPFFGGKHTGEFYLPVPPYQIAYGTLVPREIENLLVPVAVSSSHVGFCALRLEPIWMSLGQAAGVAAHFAIRDRVPVQHVNVPRVQRELHRQRSATIFVSDVPPDSPLFEAVQWFGTRGAFHGLVPAPEKYGQRGRSIVSQYTENYPYHALEPQRPVDAALLERWIALLPGREQARARHDAALRADGRLTRGEALQRLFRLVR